MDYKNKAFEQYEEMAEKIRQSVFQGIIGGYFKNKGNYSLGKALYDTNKIKQNYSFKNGRYI